MDDQIFKGAGKTIGSIQKAAQILELLAQSSAGLGATEISRQLGCGVSGAYHILNTMRACGMLDQDPSSKKYQIGFGLYRICALSRSQDVLCRIAQPYLDRLSQICGEISSLTLVRGLQIVYAAQASMPDKIQMFTQLGGNAPYYCTGAGKAWLAFQDRSEWQRYIRNTEFTRYTSHTVADGESLRAELEEIRRTGLAYDREEREDGVFCIAVPVLNAAGKATAAISVSGPTSRIREKLANAALAETVRRTAAQLTEELR